MPISLAESYRFCPRCGSPVREPGRHPLVCEVCRKSVYFSPVIGAVAVIADALGRVLLVIRDREPGRGLYGLPGGVVDPGESVEEALAREVYEEVGLRVRELTYIGSFPNPYTHQGIVLPVTDVAFACQVDSFDARPCAPGEVAGVAWEQPTADVRGRMAFASNRLALELYCGGSQGDTI
jgi:NADH pyrophosphatase NudC (nudix superfamily)